MYEYIREAEIDSTILISPDEIGKIVRWEWSKCPVVIDCMVQAIEMGDDFPPVPVMVLFDGTIMLTTQAKIINPYIDRELVDGGHHRAVAYYIANKCMPIKIYGRPGEYNSMLLQAARNPIEIKDIIIDEDPNSHEYKMNTDDRYQEAYLKIYGVTYNTIYIRR